MCSVCLVKEYGLARVTLACNVAFNGFGVWLRLVRRLPRPNIAFKGTRLGEAFLGSRVSSVQGRCSGFIVGVPLNLTLYFGRRKRVVLWQQIISLKGYVLEGTI